jgi:hypothetical protein
MSITVVIARHDRCELPDECLTHLTRRTFAAADGVIVNAESPDATEAVIGRYTRQSAVPRRGNLTGALERAIDVAFTAGYAARRGDPAFARPAAPPAEGAS